MENPISTYLSCFGCCSTAVKLLWFVNAGNCSKNKLNWMCGFFKTLFLFVCLWCTTLTCLYVWLKKILYWHLFKMLINVFRQNLVYVCKIWWGSKHFFFLNKQLFFYKDKVFKAFWTMTRKTQTQNLKTVLQSLKLRGRLY